MRSLRISAEGALMSISRGSTALLVLACLSSQVFAADKAPKVYNGAIAYHRASKSYGYAVNKATARDAQIEALRQCGNEKCEVVAKLRSNCGSVADGPKRFTVGTGVTRQESETKALRTCGEKCEIVAWTCTK